MKVSVVFIRSELPQEKGEEGGKEDDRQEDGVSAISL